MRGLRSVRATLVAGALGLVLLPLAFLGVAFAYERWIVRDYQALLERVAAEWRAGAPDLAAARRAGVEAQLLGSHAEVELDSRTGERAVSASFVGGLAERWLERLFHGEPPEALAEVERSLGPLAARADVARALAGETVRSEVSSPSGQTLLFTLAAPRPGGGALYLTKASRRGIRRLFHVRNELVKLVGYQLPFTLLFTFVFGYWLVRPLERLAAATQRYPAEPLATAALLGRRDEIGELARAVTRLAHGLEERRRAAADLGADLAHELKNPLATIAASAELIGSTDKPTPEKRQLVSEHIRAAVARLERSLDTLLALLRLEVALPDEARAAVDYAALLDEVLGEYRRDPRYSGYEFQLAVDPGIGAVRLVAARWQELVRNLVDNALVQPATRPLVIVRARRHGDVVETTVQDFGPGVSPGNRDKIFRRFFTQRPSGAPTGTGLGLSIVQAIAEGHGGTVTCDSAPGAGATFRVTCRA